MDLRALVCFNYEDADDAINTNSDSISKTHNFEQHEIGKSGCDERKLAVPTKNGIALLESGNGMKFMMYGSEINGDIISSSYAISVRSNAEEKSDGYLAFFDVKVKRATNLADVVEQGSIGGLFMSTEAVIETKQDMGLSICQMVRLDSFTYRFRVLKMGDFSAGSHSTEIENLRLLMGLMDLLG
ncbi:unnamed protein product [Dovyalis caffra]|uniref:Uncharacterized protein n=1 Tax=Dovyalis caffra TaxID=77055 RepID=A0AAV1RLE5_9ROSI|nr:unnamed protein product [Dovyalis caffra]